MSAQIQARQSPYHVYRGPLSTSPCAGASSYQQHPYHHRHPHLDPHSYHLFDIPTNTANSTDAYMNPTLPQPPPKQSFYSSPHHGVKRSAPDPEDELDRSTHISNHFKKLRLNNQSLQSDTQPPHSSDSLAAVGASQLGPSTSQPQERQQQQQHYYADLHHHPSPQRPSRPSYQAPIPTLPSDDFMTVDETPHKIYISDLDREIASIEAAERSSNQLFLPDFEKQIGAIPDHVLRSNDSSSRLDGSNPSGGESSQANAQALVLYREPVSLSIPEEEDVVRKAVLESRRGIRERMRRDQQRERETARIELGGGTGPTGHLMNTYDVSPDVHRINAVESYGSMVDDDAMQLE